MYELSHARRALAEAGLREGLAAGEVHAHLQVGLRLEDTGQRILAFYLNEMKVRRLYQASSHSSTTHFAADRLGLDKRRTSELVAAGRKLLTLPAIDCAFCEQRIGWTKVIELLRVASPEHEEEWLERAMERTCDELRLEVRLSRPGSAPRKAGDRKGLPEVRFPVHTSVSVLTHKKLELARAKLSAERGRPVADAEWLDVLADLFLEMEEKGTAAGRERVPGSLYRIVLRSEGDGEDSPLRVDTELGPVPIEGG